ncbi:hypothetical protein UY3_11458 [Chelonia mydas]|uniref:Uncharacterized protein n=1 Tax=Chelonia mydas TaxID=8469 RepID=M7BTH1_CHEMY|nr:hypothetical protein UY3_11458 [Chelonia mydas]
MLICSGTQSKPLLNLSIHTISGYLNYTPPTNLYVLAYKNLPDLHRDAITVKSAWRVVIDETNLLQLRLTDASFSDRKQHVASTQRPIRIQGRNLTPADRGLIPGMFSPQRFVTAAHILPWTDDQRLQETENQGHPYPYTKYTAA